MARESRRSDVIVRRFLRVEIAWIFIVFCCLLDKVGLSRISYLDWEREKSG